MAQPDSIYARLKHDHRMVEQLLQQMQDTKTTQADERQRLVGELKRELLAHAHAEQKVLYKELESHQEAKEFALEAEEEHGVAERLLTELENTDPADEHWKAKAAVLKEIIEHHVEEEERHMFRQARQMIDQNLEMQLMQKFESQRQQEQKRL